MQQANKLALLAVQEHTVAPDPLAQGRAKRGVAGGKTKMFDAIEVVSPIVDVSTCTTLMVGGAGYAREWDEASLPLGCGHSMISFALCDGGAGDDDASSDVSIM